ncbi:hypothetical protein EV424DRAFT_1535775 [Suillus variegatus]|nr:hypothetical protein EV424DRAFT_1535775 [Suillus variegatus]
MAPFTAAMLTTTPSPEPEPVAQGHSEDARMEDTNTESNTDRLFGAWTTILTSLEGCVMTAPDLKPELLEDQEMWLREWHSVLATLNGCSEHAGVLGVELDMSDKGAEFLKQGRKSCKEIEAVIKEWKVKAIEAVPEAPPKRAAHATGASEAEGCRQKGVLTCALARPCKPMPKRPAPGSAKETASSIAFGEEEESDGSEMEVEIVGECTVEEKVVRTSHDISVRAIGPLASGSAPKGKGKFKDPVEELEEVLVESCTFEGGERTFACDFFGHAPICVHSTGTPPGAF